MTVKQVKKLQKNILKLEKENLMLKKSDCYVQAKLRQKLNVIHLLRFQHPIKTLCKILKVNRSTYYKHFKTA